MLAGNQLVYLSLVIGGSTNYVIHRSVQLFCVIMHIASSLVCRCGVSILPATKLCGGGRWGGPHVGGRHGDDRWRPPLALAAATPDILVPGEENPVINVPATSR